MLERTHSFGIKNKRNTDIQKIMEDVLQKNLNYSTKTAKLGNTLLRINYFDENVDKELQKENKITILKEPEKKIPPTSMNEILKELVNLDSNIEASAILKTDGEILASAISTRISESLFTTIAMNLSMIGTDIIEGLSAGTLKSISVQGSNGVLSLAPIDKKNPNLKDMILILFSDPKVKSGIISFAVHIVKKQVKEYLGFEIQ